MITWKTSPPAPPPACRCVYVACLACSAATSRYSCTDGEEALAQADAEAKRRGWVLLPNRVDRQGHTRHENWICGDCALEIVGMFANARGVEAAP